MQFIGQLLFLLIIGCTGYILYKRIKFISSAIRLGKSVEITDNKSLRWRNMLLFALGQKKMFRNFIPAFLHLLIYAGFIIVNIEVLESVGVESISDSLEDMGKRLIITNVHPKA